MKWRKKATWNWDSKNWITSMKDDSKLYKALSFTKQAWQDLLTKGSGNAPRKGWLGSWGEKANGFCPQIQRQIRTKMGGTLRHRQSLLQWRICSSKHGRWQMYAAHQWQVLEAVLPLKTSYIGLEWCLHGQSLFLGTCSSNPPLLEFSSLCWNF